MAKILIQTQNSYFLIFLIIFLKINEECFPNCTRYKARLFNRVVFNRFQP